jgi:uncharacterized cupredoxin-like copper-binding protein
MIRVGRALGAGLALSVALAATLPTRSPSQVAAAPSQTVEVRAREFAFEPKELTVRPGEITFVVRNVGAIEHNFVIQDGARRTIGEIAVIPPGTAEEVRVILRVRTYQMVCTLPGHKDAGMVGTLKVAP